jgi:membrane peptidoglycan carboxypeptidase
MKKVFVWILLGSGFLTLAIISIAGRFYWENFHKPAQEFDLADVFTMEKTSVVLDRSGIPIGEFYLQNRQPISLKEIPSHAITAFLVAEDQRFWQHSGVDVRGIVRAFWENLRGGRISQGGSTITQQLARNSFDLKTKSYSRKMLEIALALRIEKEIDKETILEAYLNRVYFGSGYYGLGAASLGYFGVPASQIDVAQAATLASVLRSPNQLSPKNDLAKATRSRNLVLRQLRDLGFVREDEFQKISATPLGTVPPPTQKLGMYPVEMIRQRVLSIIGFEKTMSGGLRIETSLDWPLQKKMEEESSLQLRTVEIQYRRELPETLLDYVEGAKSTPPSYLQVAGLVVENETGEILALLGGRDFSHSEYNRATQMRRPSSQAFVPFVLLSAFREGVFAGSVFQDWPLDNKFVGIGGAEGILGEWGVEVVENSYEGPITLREAFSKGKNAAIARLGFQVSPESIAKLASEIGIRLPNQFSSNISLGMLPVSLQELARAYTVFPNGGEIADEPHLVRRILSPRGEILFERQTKGKSIVAPSTAYQVHSMMEEGMLYGPSSKARSSGLHHPTAVARSGTSYDFRDLWVAGYDSKITCVLWVGFDKPARIFLGAFSSDVVLPIWSSVMNWSWDNLHPEPIATPIGLTKVMICSASGNLASPECSMESSSKFSVREEYDRLDAPPRDQCHVHSPLSKRRPPSEDDTEWPRATPVTDLTKIRPVSLDSFPVVGADPYGSYSYFQQSILNVSPAEPAELAHLPLSSEENE